MSEDDIQLALTIFADANREGVVDMVEAMEDDALWERNSKRMAPDVRVRFVTPDASGPIVMEQEYEGIEGLRTGWRAWTAPWDRYAIAVEDVIDAGDGRVVLLVTSTARMRDSETEVPQSAATTFVVKGGLIAEIDFYLDQQQAKRDAGLGR